VSNFAIVLAAGASRRMGRCKASLPWLEGKTLLAYQVQQWLLAGFSPVVVLGAHNCDRQQDCPSGSLVAINPDPSVGKTSSILIGLQHVPQNWDVLAISAVDQPRSAKIYQKLLQEHICHSAAITVPTYQGKVGHPPLFSAKMQPHLANLREETLGLRQLMKRYPAIQKVEFDTPDVLVDLNTPESYQLQLFRGFKKNCRSVIIDT
jgi:molybdenum cofactor cytidylyltransferase